MPAVKDAPPPGSSQLRCGKAPGDVPAGGTASPPRPGALPLPAQGAGQHHLRGRLHDPAVGKGRMNDRPTLLLEHHLKELKLPSFLREYGKLAAPVRRRGSGPSQLPAPAGRTGNSSSATSAWCSAGSERRDSPPSRVWDTFDFLAIPSVNKVLVAELARCEYIQRRENVIAVGNSGAGKTHVALGLGLAACQRGMSVGFTTAAALVHELMEARGRETPAQPPAADVPPRPADHRRTGLRAPVPHRGGTALRSLQPALRAGAPSWSPPTSPSTSGPRSSGLSASPERCWTGSPTTSTSWR